MSNPIQPEFKDVMNQLAASLDGMFNPDKENKTVGFALLMFPFETNGEGRLNYISNADMLDMRKLFKQALAQIEGRMAKEEDTRH